MRVINKTVDTEEAMKDALSLIIVRLTEQASPLSPL